MTKTKMFPLFWYASELIHNLNDILMGFFYKTIESRGLSPIRVKISIFYLKKTIVLCISINNWNIVIKDISIYLSDLFKNQLFHL